MDLGKWNGTTWDTGNGTGGFSIYNLEEVAGLTAKLDLTGGTVGVGSDALSTNLGTYDPTNDVVNFSGHSNAFTASFDKTGLTDGIYEKVYTLTSQDENLPGGTAGTALTLTLHAEVQLVPEPATLAMLATGLLGLLAYAWRKRK